VTPLDVQRAIGPALGHRIILVSGTERSGTGIDDVIADVVHQIPIPDAATVVGERTSS
jgi:hypothetical protein